MAQPEASISEAPLQYPPVPQFQIVPGPSSSSPFLGHFAHRAEVNNPPPNAQSVYPTFQRALDLTKALDVCPSIETLKTLEEAELYKPAHKCRRLGNTQGLEARIGSKSSSKGKERADKSERVSLFSDCEEEFEEGEGPAMVRDFDVTGEEQMDLDINDEIAELGGIYEEYYWQVPSPSMGMITANLQTELTPSSACRVKNKTLCYTHECECDCTETSTEWMLDSGASLHFTGDLNDFIDYSPLSEQIDVQTANSSATIVGKGTILLMLSSSENL